MEGLIKITPNKEKAKSILKMAKTTLKMIENINETEFPSNVVKEYYDVIREMITATLLLDGYKTYGKEAHKRLIEYLQMNYKEFTQYEISVLDSLRITRNKIAYDGFFVTEDYLNRKKKDILKITNKLMKILDKKLG